MVYTLCKYPDETEVVFSDIRKKDNGEEYIRVSFERPTEHGFDTVVFELPSYKIIEREGNYSDEEVEEFKQIVERGLICFLNMHVKEILNLPSLLEIMRIQSLFWVK